MSADALRADLLAVDGVAEAEVEAGDAGAPAGVRVRLVAGADARRVGVEVQRVLAAHGMRSRFTTDDDPAPIMEVPVTTPDPEPSPPASEPPASPPPIAAVPSPPAAAPPLPASGLEAVSVEERADGLSVAVSLVDGRQASRSLETDGAGIDAAVVGALTDAAERRVELVTVEWLELEDGSVATVVMRREAGDLSAGARVTRFGRAFAVAAAAQAALDA